MNSEKYSANIRQPRFSHRDKIYSYHKKYESKQYSDSNISHASINVKDYEKFQVFKPQNIYTETIENNIIRKSKFSNTFPSKINNIRNDTYTKLTHRRNYRLRDIQQHPYSQAYVIQNHNRKNPIKTDKTIKENILNEDLENKKNFDDNEYRNKKD